VRTKPAEPILGFAHRTGSAAHNPTYADGAICPEVYRIIDQYGKPGVK